MNKNIFKKWWFWILVAILIIASIILVVVLNNRDNDDDDDVDIRDTRGSDNPFIGKWYISTDDGIFYMEFFKNDKCEYGNDSTSIKCEYEYDKNRITIDYSDDEDPIDQEYTVGSNYIKIGDKKMYKKRAKAEKELDSKETNNSSDDVDSSSNLNTKDQMIVDIKKLFDEGLAFDTGDYVKGDIPAGEYAYIKFEGSGSYYCEKNAAGEIVDNENFSSFGYVKVHAVGNLETNGVLINVSAFDKLGVKGAKEIYEKLNDQTDWNQSGYYKVGLDIDPGKYVVESIGSGYYSILSGPVSNSKIIDNDNFNGKANINIKKGQYLELSNAIITKAN